nr:hypothetical protein [Microbacterium lemovicicum]
MVSYAPAEASQVSINPLTMPFTETVIRVDAPVLPMQAEVRTFTDLTAEGIPRSDIPDMTSPCELGARTSPATLCWVHVDAGTVEVIVAPEAFVVGMNVLEMYYATQSETDVTEGVNHYAVSWAFRVS